VIDPGTVRRVAAWLKGLDLELHTVGDLCAMAGRHDPLLTSLSEAGPLAVLACHPRAVKWLFAAAGAPLRSDARLVNLRTEDAEAVLADTRQVLKPASGLSVGSGARPEGPVPGVGAEVPSASPARREGEAAWFPVIDFDRCNHCLQCLSFCLFGVYGVGADRQVAVQAPENCKANCPACARVCPEAAIIFPKHKAGPINGEAVPDAARRETIKVDISALLGGDLYARLRSRSQPRFSRERDPEEVARQQQQLLARLVESGDIPPEVLQSFRTLRNSVMPAASPKGPKPAHEPPQR